MFFVVTLLLTAAIIHYSAKRRMAFVKKEKCGKSYLLNVLI
ncbi:hypothetical protein GLYMA_10G003351v4 [Glycine max]|nr:hypothetical protein GLYMA_10G003351v4 [Glycine max]KAH1136068.1 hypothetical protein GYH30_026515 [Glycine max]